MNKAIVIFVFSVLAGGVQAQEAFKCKINGANVIQDRPCPGSVKRSDDMPKKVASTMSASPIQAEPQSSSEKLEKDKKFLDERIKARNKEREKAEAAGQIQTCEAEAQAIVRKISQVSSSAPTGIPINLAAAQAMQLDQQQRQIDIANLQTQHTAKLAQCDQLRQSFSRQFTHLSKSND